MIGARAARPGAGGVVRTRKSSPLYAVRLSAVGFDLLSRVMCGFSYRRNLGLSSASVAACSAVHPVTMVLQSALSSARSGTYEAGLKASTARQRAQEGGAKAEA